MTSRKIRVAVTQLEPEWLDLQKGVAKVCQHIGVAAKNGAQLVSFPEVFIPGYPTWIWDRVTDQDLAMKYIKNSMAIDGSEMQTIAACAAENSINVSFGFSENDRNSLYISQVLINHEGKILHKRRKLKPTHMERTVFGDASGDSLNNVWPTNAARIGQLACWEHIQPLLKLHTFSPGEEIHVSAWPPMFPHEKDSGRFGSSREGVRTLSSTYAIESQTFVLHTTAVLSQKGIESLNTSRHPLGHFGVPGGGGSAIFAPDGSQISEDLPEKEEGVIYTDLDMDLVLQAKMAADACGHYSRPDLLWLQADTRDKTVVRKEKPELELTY